MVIGVCIDGRHIMNFEEALEESCRELKLDTHFKSIEKKRDAKTFAEKIVAAFKKTPFLVKNSYLFLDSVDFCFYEDEEGHVNFAISGDIRGRDKQQINKSIATALHLCNLCESKMKYDAPLAFTFYFAKDYDGHYILINEEDTGSEVKLIDFVNRYFELENDFDWSTLPEEQVPKNKGCYKGVVSCRQVSDSKFELKVISCELVCHM